MNRTDTVAECGGSPEAALLLSRELIEQSAALLATSAELAEVSRESVLLSRQALGVRRERRAPAPNNPQQGPVVGTSPPG